MSTTIDFRCTLSAAAGEPRETFTLTLDTKTGEVSGPMEAAGRMFSSDARVADAARRDVLEAAEETLSGVRILARLTCADRPSVDDWYQAFLSE